MVSRERPEYDPAQHGVRLSFAPSYWADLAKVYPRAKEALKLARDQALVAYRKSPSDALMFNEVICLDFALNDMASTKEYFYEGREHSNADSTFPLQFDRMLATGDFKWISDVIGDPEEKLDNIRRLRETVVSSLTDVKDGAQMRQGLDQVYGMQIASILRGVEKTHGRKVAEDVQKDAVKLLDTPEVRAALKR